MALSHLYGFECLSLDWRFKIENVSNDFTKAFPCFMEQKGHVRKIISNISKEGIFRHFGISVVWIFARTLESSSSIILLLQQSLKSFIFCSMWRNSVCVWKYLYQWRKTSPVIKRRLFQSGPNVSFSKTYKRIKMKYQKKQKMFIVMTQNDQFHNASVVRVVLTEIWDFLLFFFFSVPLQKKKKVSSKSAEHYWEG